jgi:toxin-antitoxin system PIN domain toxin
MVLPDINLLVYAYNEVAPCHAAAKAWWEGLLTNEQPVGVPWAVALGFVRLVTHPAVFASPLPAGAAIARVRTWFDRPHVEALDPGPRHLDILTTLFGAIGLAGNLTTDAHLAALAIEHQCELHSSDADFGRFPGLRWRNPLV